MIAIENRNGLLCSYNTEAREFRKFDTPEDLRAFLDATGVAEVIYSPDAAWKHATAAGDASRESDFRHAAGMARLGPNSKWKVVPTKWVGDGESIEERVTAN